MAFKLFDRVQESTTSTGTGNLSLGGAITGFSTFSSRYSTGDTLYYAVHAVDASGVPTGEWEVGLGTYSAASTLTRTTVMASSNSDAAVNFSVGTKRVFVTMTALQGGSIRERLTAARTYYVRSDGSDSNDGLSNTSGGAFLTIQKAVNVVSSSLDIAAGVTVTIQVADGTYTGAVDLPVYVGAGAISIVGNTTTPANCIVSVTNANCFSCSSKTAYSVSGFKLQTTTAGSGLLASDGGTINFASCDFGACVNQHICVSAGAFITAKGNYSISGGSSGHWYAITGGVITTNNRTVTLTGTPGFSAAFVWMDRGLGMVDCFSITFTGSATGKRYIVNNNSVCFVNGASTTYLPGSIAGTTATGGQYA